MQQQSRVLTKPFVLTMLAEFALCMSVGMLLAIVPVYADDELGVGSFGVALAVAAVSPMVLVCQPLAGRYADRNGRRILVVVGGILASLTVAGYLVATSLPLLVLLRLLTGAGEAMALVGGETATLQGGVDCGSHDVIIPCARRARCRTRWMRLRRRWDLSLAGME
jgi:MFS family permease